jgi:Uma2 family endonuclease
MATVITEREAGLSTEIETLADLLHRLGDIPLDRVRFHPAPGTATEKDVERVPAGRSRLVELVEATLVEKPMGYFESRLAFVLGCLLENFVSEHDLGIILGEAALLRYRPGLVREPDVSFFSWRRFPKRKLPKGAFLDMVPDLAVEILSPANTRREMARKRKECFSGGTKLVWEIEPKTRSVAVYAAPDKCKTLDENGVLDGGRVLPGFRLAVRELFERAGAQESE